MIILFDRIRKLVSFVRNDACSLKQMDYVFSWMGAIVAVQEFCSLFLKAFLFGASTTQLGKASQLMMTRLVKNFNLCWQLAINCLRRFPLLSLLWASLVYGAAQFTWPIFISILYSCIWSHLSLLAKSLVRFRFINLMKVKMSKFLSFFVFY